MALFFAQPYDQAASGFYFDSFQDFLDKSTGLTNEYGQIVDEFELQHIDGDQIDMLLFKALGVDQGTIRAFLEACDNWREQDKINAIICVGEAGNSFDLNKDDPEDFDLELYEMDTLRDLAFHLVEEGYYGDIPEHLQCYIDYDAIARDIGMEYTEIRIAGVNYIYRCL